MHGAFINGHAVHPLLRWRPLSHRRGDVTYTPTTPATGQNLISGADETTILGVPKGGVVLGAMPYSQLGGTNSFSFSYGLFDGSSQFMVNLGDHNDLGTSDTMTRISTAHIAQLADRDIGMGRSLSVSSLIDGGFNYNYNYVNSFLIEMRVSSIGFWPALVPLHCKVGTFTPNATQDLSVAVTGLGFKPNALILLGGGDHNPFDNSEVSHAAFNMGFCDQNLNQTSISWVDRDGRGTTETAGFSSTQYAYTRLTPSGSLEFNLQVVSLDADGFTVTTRSGPGLTPLGYLALGGYVRSHVWAPSSRLSGTSGSVSGVGFTPRCGIMTGVETTSDNVADTTGVNHLSIGHWSYHPSITDPLLRQIGLARGTMDNEGSVRSINTMSNASLLYASGGATRYFDVIDLTSDGFTWAYSTDAGSNAAYRCGLLLG